MKEIHNEMSVTVVVLKVRGRDLFGCGVSTGKFILMPFFSLNLSIVEKA